VDHLLQDMTRLDAGSAGPRPHLARSANMISPKVYNDVRLERACARCAGEGARVPSIKKPYAFRIWNWLTIICQIRSLKESHPVLLSQAAQLSMRTGQQNLW